MNDLIARYQPLFLQLVRFGLVGLTAAGVNFCVVVFLVEMFAMTPLNANVFGFMFGFQVSYWGHRCWTFDARDSKHHVVLPKLLLVALLSFTANQSLFYFFMTAMGLPYPIALLIVLMIVPIMTFLLSKFWVFQ